MECNRPRRQPAVEHHRHEPCHEQAECDENRQQSRALKHPQPAETSHDHHDWPGDGPDEREAQHAEGDSAEHIGDPEPPREQPNEYHEDEKHQAQKEGLPDRSQDDRQVGWRRGELETYVAIGGKR